MSLTDVENSLLFSLIMNNKLRESGNKSPTLSKSMEDSKYPTQTIGCKERHSVKVQDLLYQQMLEDSEFCDVTILIGDMSVKAHWCILVGCPFFQSLHDSGMKESFEGSIRLSYGVPWAMKEALKFLYVGTVEITYDKVKDLLEAAEYLQITDMKKCCNEYLHILDVTDDNCVQLSLLSSLYDLDLYNKAFQYLKGHLPSVLNGDDALTLTKESVMSLLTDETLTYVTQETFLSFVVNWTNQDLETRQDHFKDLFSALHLENISREVLTDQLKNNPLIVNNETCSIKISQLICKYDCGDLIESKDSKDVILLCGGSGPGIHVGHYLLPHSDYMPLNFLYGYIVDEKRWTKFSPLPRAMKNPLMACDDNGKVLICDKSHSLESSLSLYQYASITKTWSAIRVILPENSENLYVHSIIIIQNRLFFLGSGMIAKPGASKSLKSWQCFLLEIKRDSGESTVKAVFFPRNTNSEVSASKIGDKYICVIGSKLGLDKVKQRQKSNSVCVCYDVAKDTVNKLPKGSNNDQHIFEHNGCIMTARPGKTNAKVFSFMKHRWEMRRDLAIPLPVEHPSRTDYAFTPHNNEFFIFGGKSDDAKEPLNGALTFSYETKTWEKLEDVPEVAFGSGICVANLASDLVRCHIHCPHCIFKPIRGQATYNCFNTEDLEDDDDDYDDDVSFDDYLYNDYWDDNSDMSLFEDDADGEAEVGPDYWFY